ncbi:STY1053 family phage-associated protein [Burkholderia multivorans]|uniref:STY1053 family phage-associated protein n=1 Tax=Burkholderia multivorans TaxID=87883 RepID=UPI000D013B7D|nr:hypothetical protein [Burkholderia multivorans]MDR8873551.1 hypothetical protein [Burkholderia multivorans]MDR8889421.1 hypothetical protein [Burkholderia multivorans]MDR8891785.1 hypothetical protein [Burkholderia multivorans]MDR8898411.1 hypothetical protein [Burkholderia multivorans]MDR8903970.1 hypothetical protein [Burkholderia multivorans]
MAKINVLTAFTIRLVHEGEEVVRRVEAGVQEVEDYIADHWYTKAHTGPLPAGVAAAPEKADSPQADASKDVATDAAPAKTAAKAGNK